MVFLYAVHQLLWKESQCLSCLSLTALDTFDEPCWTQPSRFINKCHRTFECTENVHCTLHLIISCSGVYTRGLWGIRENSRMQKSSSISSHGTRQEFNFLLYLYALLIMPSCVSWHSGKLGFDSARPHYWQASTWEMRCILTPRADSHLY